MAAHAKTSAHQVLCSPGQALDEQTRLAMESRLSADFSQVRVHTGANADEAARSMDAVAFTVGRDIVFRSGCYSPTSASGRHVLAHELAHVVQQARAPQVRATETGTAGDAWEVAAEEAATGRPPSSKPAVAVPGLQRYESYEHATEGDRVPGSRTAPGGVRDFSSSYDLRGGIPLTSGDINALADLYSSPAELYHADPDELLRVLKLLRRQQSDPKSVRESDWDVATGGRYNKLNLRNSPHFGARNPALVAPLPGTVSYGDNRQQFLRYYNETIVYAAEAYHHIGLPDPEHTRKYLDLATIAAGFAEHFLMDAFSAGHLFNKDDFIAQASAHLDKLSDDELKNLFKTVADRVEADPTAHALLAKYEPAEGIVHYGILDLFHPNLDKEWVFQPVLDRLYHDPEGRQVVHNALVKVVHDRLNTRPAGIDPVTGKPLKGVRVESGSGSWVLSGDTTLDTSPATQAMIAEAITQFRQEIAPYLVGPMPPAVGGGAGSAFIAAHWPRPTAASTTMIADEIRKVTEHPKGGMIDALVEALLAQLPSLLDALERRGDIQETSGKHKDS